ncbi:MAG TPA: hypothetical protein VHH90_00800 [Polyangia bacterium]|nr:hypothetical protein [Polyangia bacterium]
MRGRENSIIEAALRVLAAAAIAAGCHRGSSPAAPPPPALPAGPEALLADVVDPWTWARGVDPADALARDRERAVEDIGPFERVRAGDPTSPLVNTNADYWTRLVGVAWTRDVDVDLRGEPVDLDGDGRPDTTVTRHIHAKGGVLANPELFGLTPTPDDPRGRLGRVSVSTGVLGLREPLGPDGKPTGQIGMTCWVCHGEANPAGGAIVLGLPGARFDYGLLLATAAVLDDGNLQAAAERRARGFPAGRTVRARLLLAGPGRQDLTGEFGLDVTVPGIHSARYPGTDRVRQRTRGLVNPISVPAILAAPGMALENWSGSEAADAPWLVRAVGASGQPATALVSALGLPGGDREAARRALLFDLRNLGTLGLQQDSFPGLLWADAITGHAGLSARALEQVPALYAAASVRAMLAVPFARPSVDPTAAARGRALFAERVVGVIANRQILKVPPRSPAIAAVDGPAVAPIDPTRPLAARLAVRCADCHAASPLENVVALADHPPPLGRCSHCHLAHPALPEWTAAKVASPTPTGLVPLAALPVGRTAADELSFCEGCHSRHRDFGPLVYSSSRLFPFDADGDGDAQLNPEADRRAGGIGTDPWLAFDVPRPQWPFALPMVTVTDASRRARVADAGARTGAAWVRAAPLVGLAATAPYLHDGSVPTLRALFEPPSRRPKAFALGAAGFVLDTRLPGNGNQGHDFGTALTEAEKADLVAFLETL